MKRFYLALLVALTQATYIPKQAKPHRLSKVAFAAKDTLQGLGLVFGVGMVLIGIYKYTEYRANPLGNPLSRSVLLVIAGSALIGAYYLPMPVVKPY